MLVSRCRKATVTIACLLFASHMVRVASADELCYAAQEAVRQATVVRFEGADARAATPAGRYAASLVSQSQIERVLDEELYTHLGDNRRYYGPQHNAARDNIIAHYQSLGFSVTLETFFLPTVRPMCTNIIAERLGTTRPNEIYVVCAHYDSWNNPGADDDGAGVAATMEIARVAATWPSEATIRFIHFDAEEDGCLGSAAYVAAHTGEDFRGVVNWELIGYRRTNHRQVNIHGRPASNPLKFAVAGAIASYAGLNTYTGSTLNISDHRNFEAAGYQACMLLEVDMWVNPMYHQAGDSIDTPGYMDYEMVAAVARGVMGWLVDAAGLHPAHPVGDTNCDYVLDVNDLAPLTLALDDPNAYVLAYPHCPLADGDVDRDGQLTPADVAALQALLSTACSGPGVVAQLAPADPGVGAKFGAAVAGAGTTIAVGASGALGPPANAGATYVFTNVGTEWIQQARLVAPAGQWGAAFGAAVALEGDTLLVGAPGHDAGLADCGAVFVFTRAGEAWSLQGQLAAPVPVAGARFGSAIALDAGTALIGAPGDDPPGSGSGAVYVFERVDGAWSFVQRVQAADGTPGDRFGGAVALWESMAAVGAAGGDPAGVDAGAVYVFARAGATWSQTDVLTAADAAAGDSFGLAVALQGARLAAGRFKSTSFSAPAAAYLFEGAPGGWTQTRVVDWTQSTGISVALSGDRLVVGRKAGDLAGNTGTASVYTLSSDDPARIGVLQPWMGASGDGFGSAVASHGELFVVGAPLQDLGADDSGAAYVIDATSEGVPVVFRHPHSDEVSLTSPVWFSAAAAGQAPLSYQWRHDGVPLADGDRVSGSTTSQLQILSVDFADAGIYDVLVQNTCGAVASHPALLTVLPGPGFCRGDCNCDGLVGFADIDFFVTAIPQNFSAWVALFPHGPTCPFDNCDANGDGDVGFADIDPFVALIPSACP